MSTAGHSPPFYGGNNPDTMMGFIGGGRDRNDYTATTTSTPKQVDDNKTNKDDKDDIDTMYTADVGNHPHYDSAIAWACVFREGNVGQPRRLVVACVIADDKNDAYNKALQKLRHKEGSTRDYKLIAIDSQKIQAVCRHHQETELDATNIGVGTEVEVKVEEEKVEKKVRQEKKKDIGSEKSFEEQLREVE